MLLSLKQLFYLRQQSSFKYMMCYYLQRSTSVFLTRIHNLFTKTQCHKTLLSSRPGFESRLRKHFSDVAVLIDSNDSVIQSLIIDRTHPVRGESMHCKKRSSIILNAPRSRTQSLPCTKIIQGTGLCPLYSFTKGQGIKDDKAKKKCQSNFR